MPRKQSKRSSGYELRNFYESREVQALQPQYHNPNFHIHGLKIPFRCLIIAASGGGKTNLLLNLLNVTSGTFNDVYLFTRCLNEPLYEHLANTQTNKRTGKLNPHIHLYEGLDELRSWDLNTQFKDAGQSLIIMDDLVNEPHQETCGVGDLFIRGRKLGKGVSILYLSQSYYAIPKICRLQCNLIILRKIASTRDLQMLLRDCSLGISSEELIELYQRCVGDSITDFLTINLENSDQPFSKNLGEEIC
jgi:hypothetical protein